MKQTVLALSPHKLTEHQIVDHARIGKGTQKLLNDGGHLITFKIITSGDTYFFYVLTR